MIKSNTKEYVYLEQVVEKLPYPCWFDSNDGEHLDYLMVMNDCNHTFYFKLDQGVHLYKGHSWYMIPYEKVDLIVKEIEYYLEEVC